MPELSIDDSPKVLVLEKTNMAADASWPVPVQLTSLSFVPLVVSTLKPELIVSPLVPPRISTVSATLFVQAILPGSPVWFLQAPAVTTIRLPAPILLVVPEERGDVEPVPLSLSALASKVQVPPLASNSWITKALLFEVPLSIWMLVGSLAPAVFVQMTSVRLAFESPNSVSRPTRLVQPVPEMVKLASVVPLRSKAVATSRLPEVGVLANVADAGSPVFEADWRLDG